VLSERQCKFSNINNHQHYQANINNHQQETPTPTSTQQQQIPTLTPTLSHFNNNNTTRPSETMKTKIEIILLLRWFNIVVELKYIHWIIHCLYFLQSLEIFPKTILEVFFQIKIHITTNIYSMWCKT